MAASVVAGAASSAAQTTFSPCSSPDPQRQMPTLSPLITSTSSRQLTPQQANSHAAKDRTSQYSNVSISHRSRPHSQVFPIFHSSLPYTSVRDFAYPITHPFHYGPPPEPSRPPSEFSTAESDSLKGLSDSAPTWDTYGAWKAGGWEGDASIKTGQSIHLADGPPWSEDEDLQSPVVVSSRHRKHKSTSSGHGRGRTRSRKEDKEQAVGTLNQENYEQDRGYFVGTACDGSERYYINQGGDEADGPGGEVVTYPPEWARHSTLAPSEGSGRRDSHFAGTLPSRSYTDKTGQEYRLDLEASSSASSPGLTRHVGSRYSRDYQFTIASPDEEMHGKAVALFDFERENENELPLVEGQVIWVSYRHGQGWLVAEDPRTQESGLVPEAYVRLLRDIQGGLNSLTGQTSDQPFSPSGDSETPTQAEHAQSFAASAANSGGIGSGSGSGNGGGNGSRNSNGYHQPVVSTFSTSSQDLHPFPPHLLGTQAGQMPPQVIHYQGQGGIQTNASTARTGSAKEEQSRPGHSG